MDQRRQGKMKIVLDVSAAIGILMKKESAAKYYNALQESSLVIAPDLYVSELANTVWKYDFLKNQLQGESIKMIEDGINYIGYFINSKELWQEAFSEGIKNKHSVYDMYYMVAARRNGAVLVTNDSVLASICKKNRIDVCC